MEMGEVVIISEKRVGDLNILVYLKKISIFEKYILTDYLKFINWVNTKQWEEFVMINISFSELGYLILDFMKRHKVITILLILLVISFVHRQYHVIRLSKPLKAGAYTVINSLVTWWELPESEGGGGRKPLNEVDFATFYDNIEKYYQIDEYTRIITPRRSNVHSSGSMVDIQGMDGCYGIDIIANKPHHIRLKGFTGTMKGGGLDISFFTTIDLSKGNVKPRVWISQRFPWQKQLWKT